MAMWALVGDNECAIKRRLNQRSSMVNMDGSSEVYNLSVGPKCCVACKLFSPEL